MDIVAHAFPPYLVEQFASWHHRRFAPNSTWHSRLAEHGQRPRSMVVSCCDSRVDTVQMFGAEPGDLFVVRNVANLVPPFSPDHSHHGTSAAVEYAVTVLEVAHIVVIGHSNCGGVAACHSMCSGGAGHIEVSESFIGRWMEILRPGWERVRAQRLGPDNLLRALEHEAVLTSLRNLAGFPFVARAVAENRLTLHGGWVDIATGRLHTYSAADGGFAEVALAAS